MFFSECYHDHLDLHSFPTRRSSDLLKAADSPRTGEAVCRAVTDFIRQFRLPYRLRELGIPKADLPAVAADALDRKSTRLNSSHANISYAVFCLKKKKQQPRPVPSLA